MENLKYYFRPLPRTKSESIALLFLRLIVGVAFIIHGSGKIQNPTSWMPQEVMNIPGILQLMASIAEFGGGLALCFGLLTPLASLGIACTMTVAVYMHMIVRHDPFVSLTGGMSYEPALGYLGIAILFLIMGPGNFSLDKLILDVRKNEHLK